MSNSADTLELMLSIRFIYGLLSKLFTVLVKTEIALRNRAKSKNLVQFSEFIRAGQEPRETWDLFLSSYFFWTPAYIREHRRFFSESARGFGEESFHAMWLSLFEEHKFRNCLEIGVYRGQVLSLWALLQKNLSFEGSVLGISPLDNTGDAYSSYSKMDYLADIEHNFSVFNLLPPSILPFRSQAPEVKNALLGKTFDLVYVDGSHDFEDVVYDVNLASEHLDEGGILVLDDSGLFLGYQARFFSFSGHQGPSLVAKNLDGNGFALLGLCGHNAIFKKVTTTSE